MLRRMGVKRWGVFSALLVGGCLGGFSQVYQEDTPLSPNDAERSLKSAFATFQIPVLERSPNGRVRSGTFDPQQVWGSLALDRVICGADESVDGKLHPVPDEFEIVATIRTRHQAGTRVDLDGFGHILSEEGKKISCRLRETFANSILAAMPTSFRGWGSRQKGPSIDVPSRP
jgi:hypothetical protein